MGKQVKNPSGGVHTVPDDFEAAEEWGREGEGWSFLSEDEARAEAPALFGAEDPAVLHARLTDERAVDPTDEAVPPPSEPQPVDADGNPIPTPDAEPVADPEPEA